MECEATLLIVGRTDTEVVFNNRRVVHSYKTVGEHTKILRPMLIKSLDEYDVARGRICRDYSFVIAMDELRGEASALFKAVRFPRDVLVQHIDSYTGHLGSLLAFSREVGHPCRYSYGIGYDGTRPPLHQIYALSKYEKKPRALLEPYYEPI